jgi:NAD(P) transhydrogenase subunit alpha
MEPMAIVSIFVLSVFVGFEVVSKVSSTLHTPLMSGANAIHGVILVGAIIVDFQLPRLSWQLSTWWAVLLLPTECLRCSKEIRNEPHRI